MKEKVISIAEKMKLKKPPVPLPEPEQPVDNRELGSWTFQRMPDNPACYQVSVGAGLALGTKKYLGFRGDPKKVEQMLKQAHFAMKEYNADVRSKKRP